MAGAGGGGAGALLPERPERPVGAQAVMNAGFRDPGQALKRIRGVFSSHLPSLDLNFGLCKSWGKCKESEETLGALEASGSLRREGGGREDGRQTLTCCWQTAGVHPFCHASVHADTSKHGPQAVFCHVLFSGRHPQTCVLVC